MGYPLYNIKWEAAPTHPELNLNEVNIWSASINSKSGTDRMAGFKRLLSEDERLHADRFYLNKSHDCYVVARGLLRMILSRYLNHRHSKIFFSYNHYGKPYPQVA